MLKAPADLIIAFIIISVMLTMAMAVFITIIIFRYQQKQNIYFKDREALEKLHKINLLQSQLEIQEHTFQTISQEIHDNIGLKLTLAKLHLATLNFADVKKAESQINDSVDSIGEAINDLRDLSRSLSSEIIVKQGLIKALEIETEQLAKSGMYKANFSIAGKIAFVDTRTSLIAFRMVQEALNNIIKHAAASTIDINLHYTDHALSILINDNGRGFNIDESHTGSGLQNIKKRVAMLKGNVNISSAPGAGTNIKIEIPLHENNNTI